MLRHRCFSGQGCVFGMPSTPLITPKNQLEAREGPIHHPQLGPALNLLARMELFHFPSSRPSSSSSYTPFPKPRPPSPTPTPKKVPPTLPPPPPNPLPPPKFHRLHRGHSPAKANLRGALCFRLKNTLAIQTRLNIWRCGGPLKEKKKKN